MSTFDAIIFDMDGLLVDSETVWEVAESDMIRDHGNIYDPAKREEIVGLAVPEFIERLQDFYSFSKNTAELVDELVERMLERIPTEVKPQPGAPELLEYVVQQGFPVAIASASPVPIIDAIVESQGWGDIFGARASTDYVLRGKPAPDVYIYAAGLVGCATPRCLALEDSPNGSRAAVAAGMTCYAVPDPAHSTPEVFADVTPHVFSDLHAVLEQLRQAERTR